MRIGIVGGTGSEGRGLAARLARAGADITIGSRDLERASETADRLREADPGSTIRGASNREAVETGEVILLAIPVGGLEATLVSVAGSFRPGTLVVDVTVPIVFDRGAPRFVELPDGSAGELVRRLLPESVAVACAFKTLPASLLELSDPLACDDFVCGDSKASRERAMALVASIPSLRPVDAGPLESARIIERLTLLAIRLNRRYKTREARFQVVGIAP